MAINEEQLNEERRLCYVAITRAKKSLLISYAKQSGELSRFLQEPAGNRSQG
ncbi:MAG TPA: 3'-5' exonuclease [Microbacteriaceae bacterium]